MAFEKGLQKIYAALCLIVPLFIWPKGGNSDHFYLPKLVLLVLFTFVLLVYLFYHREEIKKWQIVK